MNTTSYANKLYSAAEKYGLITVLSQFGRGLHFRIPMPQTLWDTSIDELNLTVRSRNGLMRARATTIGEASELIMSDGGLEAIRNLGRKSISEIKTVILLKCYEQLGENARLAFWQHFVENNNIG